MRCRFVGSLQAALFVLTWPWYWPACQLMMVFVAMWWVSVILLVRYWNRLRDRLTARRPAEAWPDLPAPDDPTDPYWHRWANG